MTYNKFNHCCIVFFLSILFFVKNVIFGAENDAGKIDVNMKIKLTSTNEFVVDSSGLKIPLGKYRHFKGNFYQVLGVCKHTETQEELIFYKALYGNYDCWVRPVKVFFEEIEYENLKQPRFVFIENIKM